MRSPIYETRQYKGENYLCITEIRAGGMHLVKALAYYDKMVDIVLHIDAWHALPLVAVF
jgi:hypothetical protein